LPAQDQEGLADAQGPARKADQLRRAEARSVEQLEQGEVAAGERLAAEGAGLGSFEECGNFVRIQDLGQRPLDRGTGQCGGGIVLADPLLHQEAEEAPQRRRPPSDRG
jgi:hypothetical protein